MFYSVLENTIFPVFSANPFLASTLQNGSSFRTHKIENKYDNQTLLQLLRRSSGEQSRTVPFVTCESDEGSKHLLADPDDTFPGTSHHNCDLMRSPQVLGDDNNAKLYSFLTFQDDVECPRSPSSNGVHGNENNNSGRPSFTVLKRPWELVPWPHFLGASDPVMSKPS